MCAAGTPWQQRGASRCRRPPRQAPPRQTPRLAQGNRRKHPLMVFRVKSNPSTPHILYAAFRTIPRRASPLRTADPTFNTVYFMAGECQRFAHLCGVVWLSATATSPCHRGPGQTYTFRMVARALVWTAGAVVGAGAVVLVLPRLRAAVKKLWEGDAEGTQCRTDSLSCSRQ